MTADESFIGFGLHDAVLETIRVDWVSGTAELELQAVVPRRERVVLRAEKIAELVYPRRQPWGTGDHVFYVNDVREQRGEAGGEHRLEIELGSGDVIVIAAGSIQRRTV
jgi:hypothetical protein